MNKLYSTDAPDLVLLTEHPPTECFTVVEAAVEAVPGAEVVLGTEVVPATEALGGGV
jgi:hypothetical protein